MIEIFKLYIEMVKKYAVYLLAFLKNAIQHILPLSKEDTIVENKEPIEKEGFILDSVEYVKENGTYFLRIVIDK